MPDFRAWYASGSDISDCRLLLVAARPDDEVFGLGARLRCLPRAPALHLTDGVPCGARSVEDPPTFRRLARWGGG